MHLAIRVDGGPEIGYGHLVRTGALANEINSRGHSVTIATTTPRAAREVGLSGMDIVELPNPTDPSPFVDYIESERPNIAFIDAYPANTAYQRAVRERVSLVVWQDDTRHAVCADAFVNGNLYASDLDYDFVGPRPRTCLGTDYVLLRGAICDLAERDPPWREDPERAVVTMGGSDVANVTPTAVRAFDGFDVRVDAIVGPGFSSAQAASICAAADAVSVDIRVVHDPDDLPERMFRADFAVSTASSTVYELLALGTPLVCVPVADNQEPIATALRDREVGTVVERRAGLNGFRAAVEAYATDPDLPRRRREDGQKLADGCGVERIVDLIRTTLEK